jgi:uncharacterized protein (DUF1800 family)
VFGVAQAERLLWRAGFGPRPGEAAALAKKGLTRAVRTLTHPPPETLVGPAPVDEKGVPIAPYDATGHEHLWWLDRMVRSNRQLVERMTLVWHDWFATSNSGVGNQRQMLDQNELLRRNALGSFEAMLIDVTKDPAMLVWLSGNSNTKRRPNENYAREMMELFTLGAGRGYTEQDVREQARALTGWRNDYIQGVGRTNFRFDPALFDDGLKAIFGKAGNFDWMAACKLCLEHPSHPSHFVTRLWTQFIPTAPDARTQRELEKLYLGRGYAIGPAVDAILKHPALYTGPRMVKPPVVQLAGLLRRLGRGIDSTQYFRLAAGSGQRLFYPPDVGGWDETRWLDTATFRGRWLLAREALQPLVLTDSPGASAQALVERVLTLFGKPPLSYKTRRALVAFAKKSLAEGGSAAQVENALRHLLAMSPELTTC